MKLLLDTCVWGGAKKTLESSGHDVVWAGDWAEDPGDEEILLEQLSQLNQGVFGFGHLRKVHRIKIPVADYGFQPF